MTLAQLMTLADRHHLAVTKPAEQASGGDGFGVFGMAANGLI
jgi:hypothetical protein